MNGTSRYDLVRAIPLAVLLALEATIGVPGFPAWFAAWAMLDAALLVAVASHRYDDGKPWIPCLCAGCVQVGLAVIVAAAWGLRAGSFVVAASVALGIVAGAAVIGEFRRSWRGHRLALEPTSLAGVVAATLLPAASSVGSLRLAVAGSAAAFVAVVLARGDRGRTRRALANLGAQAGFSVVGLVIAIGILVLILLAAIVALIVPGD